MRYRTSDPPPFIPGPSSGLDSAQHVARRKDAWPKGLAVVVDRRPQRALVECDARARGQRRLGHKPAGEDYPVAIDLAQLAVGLSHNDPLDTGATDNIDDPRAIVRGYEHQPGKQTPGLADDRAAGLVDHCRRPDTSAETGEDRRHGDQFATDDHRPAERHQVPEMDEILQRSRRHDPERPLAGDKPGRPWRLPDARRNNDAARGDVDDPVRCRDLGAQVIADPHDGMVNPDSDAGGTSVIGEPLRVAATRHHAPILPQPEGRVRAVPWDATCLAAALGEDHRTDAEPFQLRGRSQSGRAAADDQHIRCETRVAHGPGPIAIGSWKRSAVISASVPRQLNPWQRPMAQRVRRRSPPRSRGGREPDSAVSISRRVTISQ